MKKITLLFMSLFLVLGTIWAKDEETKEDKGFTLVSVQPSSDKPVQTVDYINLGFSKNIIVTLPEENILIKSDDGKEVFEIVNAMAADANVMFLLQKVVVSNDKEKQTEKKDDKGDDEETAITYISTPGTYSYTIPEGVIKSVDNEVFPETTLTFTIAAPAAKFPIKDYSPKETTELKEIVVMFDEEITDVKNLGSAAVMESSWWSYMSGFSSFTISEDKKSVTLKLTTPITTVGNYFVELYPGTFISANGENEYGWLDFKVIDPVPGFTTNYNDGDRVKELGNLEITFKNVTEFEMVEDKAIIAVLPSGDEIAGDVKKETNKFVVSFDADFTEVGTYTFIIPAGTFTMDGAENEGRIINVELYSFEIVPLKIDDVYPKAGETVDQLDRIVIKFNQIISLTRSEDGNWLSREINLTCGDKTYTLTYNSSSNISDQLEYLVNAEWDGFKYITTPITEAGEYTLDLSQIIVDYAGEVEQGQWGPEATWHRQNQACEGTYSVTVSGNAAGIKDVPVIEGEQIIYNLLGRRVENISDAGIYIVNGKKVIVK